MFDMRMQIFRRLQRLDVSFFDRNPVGRLMTRLTNDVETLNEMFTSGVVAIFLDIFTLAGIVVVLLWLNWKLALITFTVLPLLYVCAHMFRIKARDSYRNVRIRLASLNTFLQENVTGMSVVQIFNREQGQFRRFTHLNQDLYDAHIQGVIAYAVFYPAVELLSAVAIALDHRVRRAGRDGRCDDLRFAGGLHPVRAALLPPHQRSLGKVQRPAVGHGVVGAHLRRARRSCGDSVAGDPAAEEWIASDGGRLHRV